MNSILFLFRRKFTFSARWVLLATGYDARQKDFMERLYGVYIGIILAAWVLLMLAWSVSSITRAFAGLKFDVTLLYFPLFYALALWLALVPWFAQRAYDLYRFSLPDLDFLAGAPIRTPLIAMSWFLKSLFTRRNGGVVLGMGVLGGGIGGLNGGSDTLGLIAGLCAGAIFVTAARAFLWILGLLRYRPVPALGTVQAYGLSALLLALLVSPFHRQVFLPAWLASSVVSGRYPSVQSILWSLGGLAVMAAAGLVCLFILSRTTLLAPAFEEGRLGGQLRRSASLGTLAPGEARMQSSLERRLAQGEALPGVGQEAGNPFAGVPGALLLKQQMRLIRLPRMQLVFTLLLPLLLGVVLAAGMMALPRLALRIEVLAPAAFLAAFALLRSAAEILRSDLAHIDFFAGWPVSRFRLVTYDLALGFVLPLVGGEIAVLAMIALSLAGPGPGIAPVGTALEWLVLWPFLVLVSAAAALVDYARLLGKWAATPETLPDLGPAPVVATAVAWLLVVMGGTSAGLL